MLAQAMEDRSPLWAPSGASSPDDIPMAQRAGFEVQLELAGQQWEPLRQAIEELSAKLRVSGERRIHVLLGAPQQIPESKDVLVVEADIERWKDAMRATTAIVVSPTVALEYQARIVLEVSGLLAHPEQRELALRSVALRRPWIHGNENESLALQLTLATIAARSDLSQLALRLLDQAGSSSSSIDAALKLSLSHQESSSVLDQCFYAIQTFARATSSISSELSTASDEELMHWFAEGHTRLATEELMRRYKEAVYSFIHRLVEDREKATEVLQTVFVEGLSDARNFSRRMTVKTWLLSIATRRALEARRRSLPSIAFFGEVDTGSESPRPNISEMNEEILRQRLERAINILPPKMKEAVLMRQAGLSYEEIAQATGERAGTIQARVTRAYPILRSAIESRAYADDQD